MPFLTQRQIAINLRSKAEKDYKAQLRAALLSPALTAEQRRDIQTRLTQVGHPKVYDARTPPVQGAIEFHPIVPPVSSKEPVLPTRLVLQGMKKADLQALAEQHGYPTTGTRADLIERLTAA